MTNAPETARFRHIDTWVFDLDNTLYPHHTNLFSQIDVKMTSYVQELLKLPREEARKLQKELYLEYGTTLAGLMARHEINSDDFLQRVHDIDYTWLKPDPELGEAIKALPGRKLILTNGSKQHAENTARQLGILEHFEDIFDIVSADLKPKPAQHAYDKFIALHKVAGENAVMFEDIARNLLVPKALGMTTVLVVPRNFEATFSDIWERDPDQEDHVDYVTDDLTTFLKAVMESDQRRAGERRQSRSEDR